MASLVCGAAAILLVKHQVSEKLSSTTIVRFVANPDTCTLRIINLYNFSGPELCWATPETGPRKSCLFPFTYRNHSYSACLTDEVHKAWCPTGKTIEDKYTGWAECDLDCPKTGDGKLTKFSISIT